jgi:ubiquinone/menaquinone biosynthesis C-methylase UbiE
MPTVEETNVEIRPKAVDGGKGPAHFLARHAASPKGVVGTLFGIAMKRMNREPYDWVLDEMMDLPAERVLEIGFGAGHGLGLLARRNPRVQLFGLEHSTAMLRSARSTNKRYVREGRIQLMLGSANAIPLPDSHVSQVLCVHVTYFWKAPSKELTECYRVLSTGGKIYIFIGDQEEMMRVRMTQTGVYSLHSTEYMKECLELAGFSNIIVKKGDVKSGPISKGLCIIAEKGTR